MCETNIHELFFVPDPVARRRKPGGVFLPSGPWPGPARHKQSRVTALVLYRVDFNYCITVEAMLGARLKHATGYRGLQTGM